MRKLSLQYFDLQGLRGGTCVITIVGNVCKAARILLYIMLLPALKTFAQNPAENIFIKTDISRTACFVGEPVVVTFTLYSEGPAIASGQRSPAFYGFSIVDLINYKEPIAGIAEWKGKIYATSVLRKVLLYPVQPGKLVVDPMYIETVAEVFDSIQEGKTEVKKEVVSKPIEVTVQPLPEKPVHYTGAVGRFQIKADLKPSSFPVNQQGKLMVVLEGNGNFINSGQPYVAWPAGVEGFEPSVKENLSRNDSGISGTRVYEFPFTVNKIGKFEVPAVQFTFFDPLTGKYKLIQTENFAFEVYQAPPLNEKIIETGRQNSPLILASLVILLVGTFIFLWLRKKKQRGKSAMDMNQNQVKKKFDPPYKREALLSRTDPEICTALMQALDQFIKKNQDNVTREEITEATSIKKELQGMLYSNSIERPKLHALVERSYQLFDRNHSAYL